MSKSEAANLWVFLSRGIYKSSLAENIVINAENNVSVSSFFMARNDTAPLTQDAVCLLADSFSS